MKLKIVIPGKLKEKSYDLRIQEYIKWISKYITIEIIYLKESDLKTLTNKQLYHINLNNYSICLTEEGKQYSSVDFSKLIYNQSKEIVFLLGPADGHDQIIKNKSNIKLSLSNFTFPHEMAFLILVEQIYRAISIHHGSKYHRF